MVPALCPLNTQHATLLRFVWPSSNLFVCFTLCNNTVLFNLVFSIPFFIFILNVHYFVYFKGTLQFHCLHWLSAPSFATIGFWLCLYIHPMIHRHTHTHIQITFIHKHTHTPHTHACIYKRFIHLSTQRYIQDCAPMTVGDWCFDWFPVDYWLIDWSTVVYCL